MAPNETGKIELKFKVGDAVRITESGVQRAGLDWHWIWGGRISYIGDVYLNHYPYKVDFENQRDYRYGYAYFSEDELNLVATRDVISKYLRSVSSENQTISSVSLNKKYTLSSAISAYADAEKFMNEVREKSMYFIKNVIFNDPATIVFWADGTKTVVKAQGDDKFDPEKGLAMAISKKALGNKGNYCNELKKWLPEENRDGRNGNA